MVSWPSLVDKTSASDQIVAIGHKSSLSSAAWSCGSVASEVTPNNILMCVFRFATMTLYRDRALGVN
jgi:hypothetical protein